MRAVGAFLTSLAMGRGVSGSTQNQALAALHFLYREVLGAGVLAWGAVLASAGRG